jgi:acyl carrier protein
MARPEVLEKVRMLVAEASAVDVKQVKAEGKLRGFGIDSARVIDLIVGIEEELGVSVKESDLPSLQTVGDLADYVDARYTG